MPTKRIVKHDGMTLVNKDNDPVSVGDKLENFRGVWARVEGGRSPHKLGSTGRIWTSVPFEGERHQQESFPTVYGCKWVTLDQCAPGNRKCRSVSHCERYGKCN